MFAAALDARGEAQQARLRRNRAPGRRPTTFGLPSVKRAGLVDDQRVDLFHALERFGVFDQDAGAARRGRRRP